MTDKEKLEEILACIAAAESEFSTSREESANYSLIYGYAEEAFKAKADLDTLLGIIKRFTIFSWYEHGGEYLLDECHDIYTGDLSKHEYETLRRLLEETEQ